MISYLNVETRTSVDLYDQRPVAVVTCEIDPDISEPDNLADPRTILEHLTETRHTHVPEVASCLRMFFYYRVPVASSDSTTGVQIDSNPYTALVQVGA
ncbi:MAG: hypothetical protein PVH24_06095, partial [Candidatus Zixiibacteriota bacterium]